MLWFILWYLSGLVLSYVFILLVRINSGELESKGYCPTPASILGSVTWSVFGPAILLYCCMIIMFMIVNSPPETSWWHKPICRTDFSQKSRK